MDDNSESSDNCCNICKLTFNNSKDSKDHYESKKHLKLKEIQRENTNGVFITNLPRNRTKEHLLHYFSRFGSIIKTQVGPTLNYMILVYENENEAKNVLGKCHKIDGHTLVVNKRLPIQQTAKNYEDPLSEECVELVKLVKNEENFDRQISLFVNFITPDSKKFNEKCKKVISDMEKVMKFVFNGLCQVHSFGSTVTNLKLKRSDIDIFVDIKERPGDDLKCLKMAKNGLYKARTFKNIMGITSAKIPIIKCEHSETDIKCDISFRNMLGVRNSQLINYYLSLDDKLRPCVLFIKYWAKIHEISGRNHLFTSYSIVMLFIFYLQKEYSFPSVKTLQIGTNPTDSRVIWNMNFTPAHKVIIEFQLLEILSKFFLFYFKFDFKTLIISPYLGDTLPKKCFSNLKTVPDDFQVYKLNSIQPLKYNKPIVLQDPFEHNVNTCNIIFENILTKFVGLCELAYDICTKNPERDILTKLLTTKLNFEFIQISQNITKKIDPQQFEITLNMPSNIEYLKEKLENSPGKTELTELWYEETIRFVYTVFEKVLKLDIDENSNLKLIKLNDQTDVYDRCTYRVMSYLNLWTSRKIDTTLIENELNECRTNFEKDIVISDHFWRQNQKFKSDTPLFTSDVDLKCLNDPIRVEITLTKIASYKKLFKSFGMFLTAKLPVWFQMYEKDMNKNV